MNTSIAGHCDVRNGVIHTGAVALMLGAALAMNVARAADNEAGRDDAVARPAATAADVQPAADAGAAVPAPDVDPDVAVPAPVPAPAAPAAPKPFRNREADAEARMRAAEERRNAADRRMAEAQEQKSRSDAEREDIEARLRDAQERMSRAASEVAAIAAERASEAMENLPSFIDARGPRRTVIGVDLDPQSRDGARVLDVSPGGPAEEAGIRKGDVIVAVNGQAIKGDAGPGDATRTVTRALRGLEPDTKVKVRVLREGKPKDFEVVARPIANGFLVHTPELRDGVQIPPFNFNYQFFGGVGGDLAGLEVTTLTPQLGRYFGASRGVLVLRAPKSDVYKLQDGDVILSIDGREPTSGSHITRILSSYQPGEALTLRVMRDHKSQDIKVTVPERRQSSVRTTWAGVPM